MAVDNTHTKYLKGSDKKAWEEYKSAYEAQQKLSNFMSGLGAPKELKRGEEYEIPIKKNQRNKK